MAYIQLSCQSITASLTREKEQDERNGLWCVKVCERETILVYVCILYMVDHGSIKTIRNV